MTRSPIRATRLFLILATALASTALASTPPEPKPPKRVYFIAQDHALINGDLYGDGERGVVLAHGGRFNKESWAPQARALVAAGFRVLAFDFRGYGESRGPGGADPLKAPVHLDVLAAVRYMWQRGVKTVSVVGGSMGGTAAAEASALLGPGEIDGLVLLAAPAGAAPQRLQGRKLFIVARDDPGPNGTPRLTKIREHYEKAPQPKELVILKGSAHAQDLFKSDQDKKLMDEIVRFLSAP